MVSYITHDRRGPIAPRGCGCGGARAPIQLTAQDIKNLETATTPIPPVNAVKREQIPHVNSVKTPQIPPANIVKNKILNSAPQSNPELIKPNKLVHVEKKIEIKPSPVIPKKDPEIKPSPIDLRDKTMIYGRGIAMENSYNKMNLPRKGCCGKS